MPYESIIVERKERVGMITLNRPQQFNTFNTALADELCKALLELEMDKDVRVVVLRGLLLLRFLIGLLGCRVVNVRE